jgi:hypothetical protein
VDGGELGQGLAELAELAGVGRSTLLLSTGGVGAKTPLYAPEERAVSTAGRVPGAVRGRG